jgi:hypothetical protein
VYLNAYESVSQPCASVARYFDFYDRRRLYWRLDRQTPDQFTSMRCLSPKQHNHEQQIIHLSLRTFFQTNGATSVGAGWNRLKLLIFYNFPDRKSGQTPSNCYIHYGQQTVSKGKMPPYNVGHDNYQAPTNRRQFNKAHLLYKT